MQVLWLTHNQATTLGEYARKAAPEEACGLIAGRGHQAIRIVPLDNVAHNPQRTYLMDSEQMQNEVREFEREGLSLIGIYHSHPSGDPLPSPADLREISYPRTAYVILGLRGRKVRLAAWLLDRQRARRVHLHIGDWPPQNLPAPDLTGAQQIAVALSIIVAFAAMLALSVYLLPPAPPIP